VAKIFQCLEAQPRNLPNLGKSGRKSSNHWKIDPVDPVILSKFFPNSGSRIVEAASCRWPEAGMPLPLYGQKKTSPAGPERGGVHCA
jgi:hypothetical protein